VVMTTEVTGCRVHYAPCPKDRQTSEHFILLDPTDPTWEKTPPKSPILVPCEVCGRQVRVTEPWEIGYVSSEDTERGWSLEKPAVDSTKQTQSAKS
jgi:hypothetical protein